MNNSKKFLALANATYRHLARNASTSVKELPPPRWERFQKIAKQLQIDEATPVYLKGGFGDKFLYTSTVILTLAGVGMAFETMYTLAFKK